MLLKWVQTNLHCLSGKRILSTSDPFDNRFAVNQAVVVDFFFDLGLGQAFDASS